MTSEATDGDDDEIDLAELLASLKAHWVSIVFVAAICTALAATYALVIAKPTYESQAIFALTTSQGSSSLAGLSGLASLAGVNLPSGQTSQASLPDMIEGRDFIVSLFGPAGLLKDPYFNPELGGPGRRVVLMKALGFPVRPVHWTKAKIDDAIVSKFQKSVTLSETKDQSTVVTVTHTDPERAAEIANVVVRKALDEILNDQIDRDQKTSDYLKSKLLAAQKQLDDASSAVQAFVIAHNALSPQILAQQSLQLEQLRQARDQTEHALKGLVALDAASTPADRSQVLQDYPELTSPNMQLMGASPLSAAAASGRDPSEIASVMKMLRAHLQNIESSINDLMKTAKLSAKDAAELLILKRDATIAEGEYKALFEQYKTQSLTAGFKNSLGKIYQSAVPALKPSKPKVSLVLALGMIIGLILGSGIALVRTMRQGILYTRNSVRAAAANARVVAFGRRFNRRRNASWTTAVKIDSKDRGVNTLSLLVVERGSKHVAVTTAEMASVGVEMVSGILAGHWARAGLSVALVSFDTDRSEDATSVIEPGLDHVALGRVERDLAAGRLADHIQEATAQHDRVVLLLPQDPDPMVVLEAVASLKPAHFTIARPGRALRIRFDDMRDFCPPSALVVL